MLPCCKTEGVTYHPSWAERNPIRVPRMPSGSGAGSTETNLKTYLEYLRMSPLENQALAAAKVQEVAVREEAL